jgi:amino acid transporter
VAIWVIAPVVAVVPILMVASGTTPLGVYAYTGTVGTFGYMLAYLLMAIALPVFLRRRTELRGASVALAVVVVLALLYVFYKNVVPVPPSPYNLLPWIFLGVLLAGVVWYLVIRARTPQVAREVGSVEEQPVPPHGVHRGEPGTAPAGPDRSPESDPTVGRT